MYISRKAIFIRNLSTSLINSLITLVLLLIAPLGLASVITNTIAIGISTFLVSITLDFIAIWLLQDDRQRRFSYRDYPYPNTFREESPSKIEKRDQDY